MKCINELWGILFQKPSCTSLLTKTTQRQLTLDTWKCKEQWFWISWLMRLMLTYLMSCLYLTHVQWQWQLCPWTGKPESSRCSYPCFLLTINSQGIEHGYTTPSSGGDAHFFLPSHENRLWLAFPLLLWWKDIFSQPEYTQINANRPPTAVAT